VLSEFMAGGKQTAILGISAFYHDSAACLVVDGRIVAAAQEERFTRRKHDHRFPGHAARYCLREAGLAAADLDYAVFYEKPYLKFDRLLETYLQHAPQGWGSFLQAMPLWLKQKLHLPREIRQGLGRGFKAPICYTRHHESHAASAFFPSPFEEAAILTLDGVGEWDTATIGTGRGNRIELLRSMSFPHSLGLLYSAFTYFTGFRVNSGEYKLMGLAPYGRPLYADLIREKLIDLKDDGSFAMDLSYFNYCAGLTMTNGKFAALFGGPPRAPESPITQREMDLAASIQQVTEEIVLRMAREAKRLTGMRHLCLAGGVALNCVANGRLRREGIFEDIWIQPAAGDAGGALGAAIFLHYQLLDQPRPPAPDDAMSGALLGPSFTNDEIRAALDAAQTPYRYIADEAALLDTCAGLLAEGKVIGWFQGRMEFGPRALGSRSILGDPRSEAMQAAMNLRIKFRESFRPFAPSVLAEDVAEYFETLHTSPYMLQVDRVNRRLAVPVADADRAKMESDPDLHRRINVRRSTIPAVTHVDMSARVQTVDEARHGRFYRLIRAFKRRTGCSVIINTSFNVRGEPMVGSPGDALRCFLNTDMDVLVLENCVLHKAGQPAASVNRAEYLAGFKPD
jgi:carbamoyltransferase